MTPQHRAEGQALSHAGRVRRINEDRHSVRDDLSVWAVADGMGGHAHGDWAANAVIQALDSLSISRAFDAATRTVADAIHSSNRRVWAEAQRRGQQMGSTVVALLIRDDCFAVLWVGDSRAYLLRDGVLHQLSRDHSQVQEMVDRGFITADEARHHPRSHVLARAIGVGQRLEVDVVTDRVAVGDVFLLCSDGLTNMLDDDAIAAILRGEDRAGALAALLDGALAGGAPDNVTAVLVGVQETTRLDFPETTI